MSEILSFLLLFVYAYFTINITVMRTWKMHEKREWGEGLFTIITIGVPV